MKIASVAAFAAFATILLSSAAYLVPNCQPGHDGFKLASSMFLAGCK